MNDVPIALLHKLLRCDPANGKLFWRSRTPDLFANGKWSVEHRCAQWNSRLAGKEAFTTQTVNGYRQGSILNHKFLAHRVIWAMTHGSWPEHEIDHINGIRDDNTVINMRSASRTENSRNQKMRSTNKSGHMGVCWFKRTKKWHAQIMTSGKAKRLGYFSDLSDAIAARKTAEIKHGYHANHGRA